MKRALLSWSSGKDSAWALHLMRAQGVEFAGLLTTFNSKADRVAMHAVRRSLVAMQAEAASLPLRAVELPLPCSNQQYEALMSEACRLAVADRIDAIVFATSSCEIFASTASGHCKAPDSSRCSRSGKCPREIWRRK